MNGESRPEAALRVLAGDESRVPNPEDSERPSCSRWCTTVSLEVHKRLARQHKLCPCPRLTVVVP